VVVAFDPETLELDSQTISFDGKRWADFVAAARIAKMNSKKVNPEIVGKGVHCHASTEFLSVSAWSEKVSCHRTVQLNRQPLEQPREFILPLETIDLVASMKPSEVVMTLDYKFEQLLIETDIGYILVDLPQAKYPVADGIQAGVEATVEVKRKELLEAVKTAVEAGAKTVNLVFDNNTVVVEAAKAKQEVKAESTGKQFTVAVKVGATALLEALKAIATTKILLHFPLAAAHSLIIDTVTGVMYVLVVTVKAAAQLIESAADVLKKPEPKKEVVKVGENSDGTAFVVENIETSPLQPELSVEEQEAKKAKLKAEHGENAELAEAVFGVADLREKVRRIVKDIDSEMEKLRAIPPSSNTVGIKGLDKVQGDIQDDAQRRLKELATLHQKLSSVVSEAETVESALELETEQFILERDFTLEGLKEVNLKLTWWGGRTLQFLWKEEAQWLPQMRISEPIVIAWEKKS
jgi:hypothetical protein